VTPDRPDEPEHGLDVDAAFADIVAHYGEVPDVDASVEEGADPPPTTPQDASPDRSAPETRDSGDAPPAAEETRSVLEPGWTDPLEIHATWDDEGHFVPPPPPPLPAVEPRRRAAWAALFGAPLVMLVVIVAGVGVPGWVVVGLALAFIGGFVYLVATMGSPGGPRWPDDGAVV
jgi:hypothetical protein